MRLSLILISIFVSIAALADEMTIGFPNFSKEINLVESDQPVARFIRASVFTPLMISYQHAAIVKGNIRALSDYVRISYDYKSWSFRIDKEFRFSDGSQVRASDVVESLKLCHENKRLPYVSNVAVNIEKNSKEDSGEWVEIKADLHTPEETARLSEAIQHCPIISGTAIEIFNEYLGKGANIIGSGEYIISDYVPGRRFQIERQAKLLGTPKSISVFDLRGYEDAAAALNALRIGGINAFYSTDEGALHKASHDETLEVSRCERGVSLIKRKGTQLPCLELLNILEVKENV